MTRRDWIKTASLAAIGTSALAGAEQDLRAKAKKNLKLAVFTGVYAGLPLEEAIRRIKADGFEGVVQEGNFADMRFDPYAPDWSVAEKITGAFQKGGLKVVGLYGYYNVVHPDPEKRKRGEARIELLIANWRRLGSPVISTETGTFNAQSEWVESPENATENGYLECRRAFEKLAKAAEKTGAVIAIEPYWRNVIGSVERTERLFREVKSPALKLTMDPCNYFRKEELPNMQPMLDDIFRRVGKQTVLAHAKDVKASADGTDLPASGLGVLDYPLYLRLLAGLDREVFLAVEHLELGDVSRAVGYVRAQFERV